MAQDALTLPFDECSGVDYEPEALLYRGTRTSTWRVRATDGTKGSKLLKLPNDASNLVDVAALREEIVILEALGRECEALRGRDDATLPPLGYLVSDPGGRLLTDQVPSSGMSLTQALKLAACVAETLRRLHADRVVHKDLNPANILFDEATGTADLVSFDICSRIPRETGQLVHPGHLEGHLAYISPEQTGRMNRAVDYRSDFYSLGAVLYQVLSGAPPFEGRDPVELVHAHIARAPLALADKGVPLVLSNLVTRLLAKNAEDRYQSSQGLIGDLQRCAERLTSEGEIEPFELGMSDRFERFRVPQKLYGREDDVGVLMAAFDRVNAGRAELVLVSGYSGIGKTALVREIHHPITARRGFFISGKFDQYRRNIPYHAFAGAFADLVRQLLTESAASVAQWKQRLLSTLGENSSLMIDLVPDLEIILGPQPPVPELGPAENEARFTAALTRFFEIFAGDDRPLVVFLDDLQWADAPSLKLVRHIAAHASGLRLMLVGAYRDNEVDASHPLRVAIDELRETALPIEDIVLGPLSPASVRSVVSDTLGCRPELTDSLSDILVAKTGGNPFFLLGFFETIWEDGHLRFDPERRSWELDAEAIVGMSSTQNVVELMAANLHKLAPSTREALTIAACIGNRFDLEKLATVIEMSAADLAALMWPAVERGTVTIQVASQPGREAASLPTLTAMALVPEGVTYVFQHDRVQEAALALVSEDQRNHIHLRIGRLLLRTVDVEALDERTFDVASHFVEAAELLEPGDEQIEVARLCLSAGRRAKNSTAYGAARRYLQTGYRQVNEDVWETHYDLAMALGFELAECAYLSGDTGEAEEMFGVIIGRARTPLEQARLCGVRTNVATFAMDYPTAVDHARAGLALLGTELPAADQVEALTAFAAADGAVVAELMTERSIADLVDLPEMSDPARIVEASLMESLSELAAFVLSPTLVSVAAVRIVRLSLEFGNCRVSAPAYATHGVMIGVVLGLSEQGYTFAKMALELARKQGQPTAEAKVRMWLSGMISHWRAHISETIEVSRVGVELGIRVGVPTSTSYSSIWVSLATLFSGRPLAETRAVFERYMPLQDGQSHAATTPYLQLVDAFTGKTDSVTGFAEEGWDDAHIATLKQGNLLMALQHYFAARLMGEVALGQTEDALATAKKAAAEGDIAIILFAQLAQVRYAFHHALALLDALREGLLPDEHDAFREQLDIYRGRVDTWATDCPANFSTMQQLIAAETAVIAGDHLAAMDRFDQAIDAASTSGLLYHQGLAAERAARFYVECGRGRIATAYVQGARRAWQRWGSPVKVNALIEAYRDRVSLAQPGPATGETGFVAADSGGLDMLSVLKAARIVSGEIELQKLLDRSMGVVIENAGAQRGVLLLGDNEGLRIAGVADIDQAQAPSTEVAQTVVDYCQRTREPVVLDKAFTHELFRDDPHIVATHPWSLLAMPLLNQGQLIGVLYLENRRSAGAFTADRVQVLEAICAQIVVSIENARLYETLEEYSQTLEDKVRERTQTLAEKNDELAATLATLKATQARIIAQERLASLGVVTAGIAHELRNPLNFVNNFAQVAGELQDELESELGPVLSELSSTTKEDIEELLHDLREGSRTIRVHGGRATKIIDAMNMLSGRGQERPRAVDLNALVEGALKLAHHGATSQLPEMQVEASTELAPSLEPVEVVAGDLNRALLNIIGNAFYAAHTNQPGRGADSSPRVVVSSKDLGSAVEISVYDNGAGIPADISEKIFTHFFTTKPPNVGTGLGLSISHNIIVEQHGGSISVSSEPGEFTRFEITIPKTTHHGLA